MTLFSFHGLFFLYNFIIQFLTIIPVILYRVNSVYIQVIVGLLYIIFTILTSNVLVIPTFEFFCFPFLKYNDPLSHFYTFTYIIENESNPENNEFKSEEKTSKNNQCVNVIMILIEGLYSLSYILGLFSIGDIVKQIIESAILLIIYIYYLVIFFRYVLISIYAIFLCGKFKKTIMPDINLLSYSIKYIYEKKDESKKKKKSFQENLILIGQILRICLIILILIILFLDKDKLNNLLMILYSIIFITTSFILDLPFYPEKKEPIDRLLI